MLNTKIKTLIAFALLMMTAVLGSGCAADRSAGGASSSGGQQPIPGITTQFAYVLNQGDNTVRQYSLSADGSLAPLATASVQTGDMPVAIAADVKLGHAYIANHNEDTVSQFTVDADGALVAINTPVATGSGPQAATISPDGASLYVLNSGDSTISQFSIGFDGALAPLGAVATGGFPLGMRFDPSGAFLYVVNVGDNSVSQFSVGSDGRLTPLAPATVATANIPAGPIVTARASGGGDFAYVLDCGNETVESFTIAGTGALSALASVPTGMCPVGMALTGSNIYVTNAVAQTISMYSIQADGSLAPLAQPTVPAGDSPEAVTVDLTGKYVYATDFYTGTVLQYAIGTDGTLSPLAVSSVATGANPVQIMIIGK